MPRPAPRLTLAAPARRCRTSRRGRHPGCVRLLLRWRQTPARPPGSSSRSTRGSRLPPPVIHVRFTPESGHRATRLACLLVPKADVGEQPGLGRPIPLCAALRALTVRLTAPRGSGVPNEISADARDDEDEGEHDYAWDRAASHALACA